MEIDSIGTFYNCTHPSGYKINREDIDYLVPINPKEKPIPVEVSLKRLFVEIETNKRNFRTSPDKDKICLNFANKYGLLTAVKKFKIYDYITGDLPYIQYMKLNIIEYRFNDEMLIEKVAKKESKRVWELLLSGIPKDGQAEFTEDKIHIDYVLSEEMSHTYDRPTKLLKPTPKTLRAAFTYFFLVNQSKEIKSCKHCNTLFLDLTKPQKTIFCSEKCKSANYRITKINLYLHDLGELSSEYDLSSTSYRDFKNNVVSLNCHKHGRVKINIENFRKSPGCPKCNVGKND